METTVEDVIKGLEICTSGKNDPASCKECPFDKMGAHCYGGLNRAALYYLKKYSSGKGGHER